MAIFCVIINTQLNALLVKVLYNVEPPFSSPLPSPCALGNDNMHIDAGNVHICVCACVCVYQCKQFVLLKVIR